MNESDDDVRGELADATSELLVVDDPTGTLLVGDRTAIDDFLAHWKSPAEVATSTEVTGRGKIRALTIAADYASARSGVVQYVRTKKDTGANRGETVVIRKWVKGPNGKIVENSPISAADLARASPATMLAAVAVQVALADMTKEITSAVERVEGKTDELLRLAHSHRTGDINGHYRLLNRRVAELDAGSNLTDTDWSSVAALGPVLEIGVERLREYLLRLVRDLPPGLSADERSDRLAKAVREGRLGETLRLLIVAEHSLYLWQRLRVEQVQEKEPHHLMQAVRSAHATLGEHLAADLELVAELRGVLNTYGSLRALEFHRKISGRRLRQNLLTLRGDLDYFVDARGLQIGEWAPLNTPTARDAFDALSTAIVDTGQATKALSGRVVDTALGGVSRAGGAIQQKVNRFRRTLYTAQPTEENPPAGGPSSPADNHGEADSG